MSNAPNEIALTQPNTLPSPTTPTQVGTPNDARSSGPAATAPQPTSPARGTAKPPGSETAKPPVLDRREEEEGRIAAVLEQYEAGYNNLEAAAVRAIHPGAPADLAKTFAQYQFYRLELVIEAIAVAPDATSAIAICQASHFIQPSVGRRYQYVRRQEFSFQKRGNAWLIVRTQDPRQQVPTSRRQHNQLRRNRRRNNRPTRRSVRRLPVAA